jgi:hypothetical protein
LSYFPIPFHPTAWDHPGRALACYILPILLFCTSKGRRIANNLAKLLYDCPRKYFLVAVFLLTTGISAWLAIDLFNGVPHLDDSVAACFQARIFLDGRVELQPPAQPEFFYVFGILSPYVGAPNWCSMYPPAWSVLLAIGYAVGAAWIVNPVLAGLLTISLADLGRELFDDRTGRTAALLAAFSPFVAVISATHLSHTSTALCCVVAWAHVMKLLRTSKKRHGVLAGVFLGWAFLTRPITTVCIGVIIGLGVLLKWREALKAWKGAALAVAAVLMAFGLQLAFQEKTTGDYRVPGHKLMMGGRGKIGFGQLDIARTHTLEIGLDYSARRLRELNTRLGGWQIPSLAFAFLPFLIGRARWQELWLVLPLCALTGLYAAYWYFEEYYPARYLFASVPFLLLLSARGFAVSTDWLKTKPGLAALPAIVLQSGILFAVFCSNADYHDFFLRDHGDVEVVYPEVIKEYGVTNALVFYNSYSQAYHWQGEYKDALHRTHHWKGDQKNRYYASAFIHNDIKLEGDVIAVMHHYNRKTGEVFDDRILPYFPNRDYYQYSYDRGAGRARLYRLDVHNQTIQGRKEISPRPDCPWLMPQ